MTRERHGPTRIGEVLLVRHGEGASGTVLGQVSGKGPAQLTAWLTVANRRQHRTLGARPVDRWEADRAQMLSLPPVDRPRWWRFATRIGRDHYIRVDPCDYSVHPLAIGKKVQVRTDTDEVVVILTPGGTEVARHLRCWAKQQTITDPVHARAAALLRGDYRHHQASQALSRRQNTAAAADLVDVEQHQLDSYDSIFTLIEGGGGDDELEVS